MVKTFHACDPLEKCCMDIFESYFGNDHKLTKYRNESCGLGSNKQLSLKYFPKTRHKDIAKIGRIVWVLQASRVYASLNFQEKWKITKAQNTCERC